MIQSSGLISLLNCVVFIKCNIYHVFASVYIAKTISENILHELSKLSQIFRSVFKMDKYFDGEALRDEKLWKLTCIWNI